MNLFNGKHHLEDKVKKLMRFYPKKNSYEKKLSQDNIEDFDSTTYFQRNSFIDIK